MDPPHLFHGHLQLEKMELVEYSVEEISKHNTMKDCWIILGSKENGGEKVYDVTSYLNDHPGGPEVMLEYAGKFRERVKIKTEKREKLFLPSFLIIFFCNIFSYFFLFFFFSKFFKGKMQKQCFKISDILKKQRN